MMNRIIVVDKPKGMTSREVVNAVGKKIGTKKIGHTGTLDPMAEGVLVLLTGKYTKLNKRLTSINKEYIATVKMGLLTDTLDLEGTVVKEDGRTATKEQLEKLFETFPKRYLQEVPLYSAVKVHGKKLYEYARCGRDVTLPKREVEIYSLKLLEVKKDTFTFQVLVSKGTYIRSLIRDFGDQLHLLFTLSSLIRTKQGKFTLDDAISIEETPSKIQEYPLEEILEIPVEVVDSKQAFAIQNGQKLPNPKGYESILFVTASNIPLAIYQKDGETLKVDVMLGGKEV